MSELREAAQAALEQWDKVSGVFRMTAETEALRAALAQPETEAQPVAWQSRYIGRGEPFGEWRTIEWSLEECANLTRGAVEHMRAQTDFEVRPLYAHPPRDEWRPASEPPDSEGKFIVWFDYDNPGAPLFDVVWYLKHGGWQALNEERITHWRDVQPPTEGSK